MCRWMDFFRPKNVEVDAPISQKKWFLTTTKIELRLIVKVCPWCGVGLLRLFFLCCGVINKLMLLLVLAAPVKRKGARGEVCFPETPLLCALFYLKGPAPCCYWLAVTCLSAVVCLSLKAVLSRLVTVL